MAVVPPRELHDPVPPRGCAGQAHRGHGGLGTRCDEPHHLHRFDCVDDPLREVDLELDRVAVCDSPIELSADRRDHPGRLVAEDVRPVGEHVVDELVAVGVDDVGSLARDDVRWHAGNRTVRTHGAVDTAGKHTLGARAKRPGVAVLHAATSALAR